MTQPLPLTPQFPTTARALWYVERGLVSLHEERLPDQISSDDVLLTTLFSAVSRGTERLVFLGAIPDSEQKRMRAPMQSGEFPFPVKYGYCTVARVDMGPPDIVGHVAFCLHPHQDRFVAPQSFIQLIPKDIPPRRAVLAANMETALNAHWDAGTKPGDRVIVIGGGIVGLLTAYLAARIAGCDVTLVDIAQSRQALAERLGFAFARPDAIPEDADVVFHTSASGAGLQSAIEAAGMEGTVCEMSWYGAKEVGLGLGGAFHSRRIRLISSQVGHVAGVNRPRWSFERRLAKAISLLDSPALDELVTNEVPFDEAPDRMADIFSDDASGLPPVFRYAAADEL
jgi:threonine dehydrogenase-like Zn-dependent dehydrogenase